MLASWLALAGLAVASLLILLANMPAEKQDYFPQLSVLTLGLSCFDGFWTLVQKLIRRLSWFDRPSFDQRKPAHRIAAILMICQLIWIGWLIAANGAMPNSEIFALDQAAMLLQVFGAAIFYLALTLGGLGWGIRRSSGAVLSRLGLRLPNRYDWGAGLLMAILLYLAVSMGTLLWARLVPPEQFNVQTKSAQLIFNALSSSLPAGLLMAVLTGTSEELLFRGALQPVFGLWISSLFFTMMHLQYALTPAALLLFVLSLGFAWLRKKVSTTAAIIAHVVYNFIPFLLFSLGSL